MADSPSSTPSRTPSDSPTTSPSRSPSPSPTSSPSASPTNTPSTSVSGTPSPSGWAAIPDPDYGSGGEVYLPQIRTEFEGGYVQSRRRVTRSIKRWFLKWSQMSEADWGYLQADFLANQGQAFTWVEPGSETSYTVRYSTDSIKWTWNEYNTREVEILLEQV